MATAGLRPLPRIVVVGAQRSGTTSLHSWLCSHPDVAPFMIKEVHYFDGAYEKGERWYRSRFPISLGSRRQVEASPYMLYHPLAAERAGRDLPQDTRFVALLREPAERALSHYQLERRKGHESETFDRALELEESRLMGTEDAVARGARSRAHRWYSYRSRGRYAGQLSRWFDSVGRERILVLESERMFDDPSAPGELLAWLGLAPVSTPFPALERHGRAEHGRRVHPGPLAGVVRARQRGPLRPPGPEALDGAISVRREGHAGVCALV